MDTFLILEINGVECTSFQAQILYSGQFFDFLDRNVLFSARIAKNGISWSKWVE